MAESMYRGDAPSNLLPPEVSSEIWQDVQEESAVMRMANRIDLPGVGMAVPMIVGDPEANWAGETDEIVADDAQIDSREMKGHKIGVIEAFSKEFQRDLPGLYAQLRQRLPKTLAKKFDATVFHAVSGSGPVNQTTFDSLTKTGVQAHSLMKDEVYASLVAIDGLVADAEGELSGYVLSPKARAVLLGEVDGDGRPLLINDIQREGAVARLLDVPVVRAKAAYKAGEEGVSDAVLGLAGDWSNAFYGVVQDIEISVSDQATITKNGNPINLWQRDMFAVKVTAHLGFMIRKGREGTFVRITDGSVSGSSLPSDGGGA